METLCRNLSNSGKPLTDNAEGNPEPSLVGGRRRDYPEMEYTVSAVEAHSNL